MAWTKDGRWYIIRTMNAGVFFGKIKEKDGQEVTLTDCRRIWYWAGAASLSQLAFEGTKKPNECKFTISVPEITVMEVIEIIPCTEKAVQNIREVRAWIA